MTLIKSSRKECEVAHERDEEEDNNWRHLPHIFSDLQGKNTYCYSSTVYMKSSHFDHIITPILPTSFYSGVTSQSMSGNWHSNGYTCYEISDLIPDLGINIPEIHTMCHLKKKNVKCICSAIKVQEVHLKCFYSTGSNLLHHCQIHSRPDSPLYARVWLCETMCDYPCNLNMKRKCKPTLSCLYIAHFAIRNNNNKLFYKFSKIEAGGGPETKYFIGVA